LDVFSDFTHLAADEDFIRRAEVGPPINVQILISGKVAHVAEEIERVRKAARLENGWIMDTYLLRKP